MPMTIKDSYRSPIDFLNDSYIILKDIHIDSDIHADADSYTL